MQTQVHTLQKTATRRTAEHAALRAANNNDRIRLVVDNTTLNQSFGYDANDRLTSWTGAWGITELYSYDANGNRSTFSVTGQTLATLAYPSTSNKFSSQTGGAMSYTPAYDATGNITSVGGIAYAYDGRNLLASSTGSGITTNYWVNDLGQRVRKTWQGSTPSHVVFTYEPGGRHLGSYGLTGSVTEETVFLGDTPVGMMVGSTNYYVYADHLGAPRTVTNTSNQSRWEWDEADPFGRILPDQNPGGLGSFNWRRGFPGQFYDAEKSAWHNGFRTYHAAFGRYLQPDPIGLAGGDFSMYGGTDPLGLEIVVDGDQGFRSDYDIAKRYLSQSPIMQRIFNRLESSPKTYRIKPAGIATGNVYDFSSRTVYWNSRQGLICSDGGSQSPALGLAHELGHAEGQDLELAPASRISDALAFIAKYTNAEEYRVISQIENPVAISLRESPRPDHGNGGVFISSSPISRSQIEER